MPDAAAGQHFVYRLEPTRIEMLTVGPTPDEMRIVGQHSNYLKDLAEKGVVTLAGRTLNDDVTTFGIVILCTGDKTAAQAVMERDPFVRSGLMRATLFPFGVAYMAAK